MLSTTNLDLGGVFASYSDDNPLEAIWDRDARDGYVYYNRQCLKLNFTEWAKTVLAASLGNGDDMVRRFEGIRPTSQPQSDICKVSATILNLVDYLVFSGENFHSAQLTISQVAPVEIVEKGNSSSFPIKPKAGFMQAGSEAIQATAPKPEPGICIAADCSFLYFYDVSIRDRYNSEALKKYRTKLEGLGIEKVVNTDPTIAHVQKGPSFVQPPMFGPSELYKPSNSKLESWIGRLPTLRLLPGVAPVDAFHQDDIIFGANCRDAVGGYASAYFFPNGRDFDAQTYRPWLGQWVGFPIHQMFSNKYVGPGVYQPELAQTPKEQQLLHALLASKYNFASRGCAGETEQNSQDRTARASKAVLEMALFHPQIRKIHFILMPFHSHMSPVGYIDERGEQYRRKSYRFTDHELRHLHRLALLYPNEVADRVICWRDHQQVQLPARLEPKLWEMWEPRLEKIRAGLPVRAKL